MASRITKPAKPARLTAEHYKTVTYRGLPDAAFVVRRYRSTDSRGQEVWSTGIPLPGDVSEATQMQKIRAEYENDLCQVSLHLELKRFGWNYDQIMDAVLNPATLTSCLYTGRLQGRDRPDAATLRQVLSAPVQSAA
jgi:hypothetical protein